MTVCKRTQDDLKAYLDGELGWMSHWLVQRHLTACVDCRQELSSMQDLQNRLRASDPGELPSALRARILAACSDIEPSALSAGSARPRLRFQPALSWGAVAGVVLLAFLYAPFLPGVDFKPGAIRTTEAVRSSAQPLDAGAASVTDPNPSSSKNEPEVGAPAPDQKRAASSSGSRRPAETDLRPVAPNAKGAVQPVRGRKATADLSLQFAKSRTNSALSPPPEESRYAELSTRSSLAEPQAGSAAPAPPAPISAGRGGAAPPPGAAGGVAASPRSMGNFGAMTFGRATDTLRDMDRSAAIQIELRVDSVAKSMLAITNSARSLGGEVVGASNAGGQLLDSLTVDVPAARLEDAVTQLKNQGEIVKVLASGENQARSQQLAEGLFSLQARPGVEGQGAASPLGFSGLVQQPEELRLENRQNLPVKPDEQTPSRALRTRNKPTNLKSDPLEEERTARRESSAAQKPGLNPEPQRRVLSAGAGTQGGAAGQGGGGFGGFGGGANKAKGETESPRDGTASTKHLGAGLQSLGTTKDRANLADRERQPAGGQNQVAGKTVDQKLAGQRPSEQKSTGQSFADQKPATMSLGRNRFGQAASNQKAQHQKSAKPGQAPKLQVGSGKKIESVGANNSLPLQDSRRFDYLYSLQKERGGQPITALRTGYARITVRLQKKAEDGPAGPAGSKKQKP